ncbi:hypothetical protein [Sphingorhabdus lutea]|uniref:hypothetical protein n=1 Tax=Sphingorhabdus lutea TaxID=1913578 RepID=UPI000A4BD517|nr:hypothetical protein [Sphingorhabdus lutea]
MENDKTKQPLGGGIFIAIGMILGAFIGIYFGQPTIGFLSGMALGSIIALTMWKKGK